MAIYSLQMKPVSRANGRSVVAAAAYRAGESMRDERTGLSWDYSRHAGVLHTEIVLPEGSPAWAQDRAALWNAAEAREDKSTRRDQALTGRDFIIALPHEFNHAERVEATRAFASSLVAKYGAAVDFAIHAPGGYGDERNYHAHVLMSTRAMGPDGFGAKLRTLDARQNGKAELSAIRETWANIANARLAAGGHDARIDHRSLEAQGIDRTATVHLGPDASAIERKGERSDLGDRNREADNLNTARAELLAEQAQITAELSDLDSERRRRTEEARAAQAKTPEAILAALTSQRSTFTEADLGRALSRVEADPYRRREMAEAIFARPDVVGLAESRGAVATRYTTAAVLAEEGSALDAARNLATDRSHAVSRRDLVRVMERGEFGGMNDEQRAALLRSTGPSGFAMLAGDAGTGKSFTLQAVRQAYEAHGSRVVGLSFTNAVVQDMARDGFKETRTISGALSDQRNGVRAWDSNTVLVVDEAAMLATKDLAELIPAAEKAGAKVILSGDDKQLASIARGGLFTTLRDQHGAAELHQVVRVKDEDQKRAFGQMHDGAFRAALQTFDEQGRVRWADTQADARAALVGQWAKDTAERPEAVRFVFAYTNAEVLALNADLRAIRRERGELGEDHRLATKDGPADFATGDRVQFTGSAWDRKEREAGLANGNVGTVREITGGRVTVALDSAKGGPARLVSFEIGEDARRGQFNAIRHGYAGTIYKGQGRTVDDAYSLHSQHWRSASSYVAATRHRDNVTIYTARELAPDLDALARQMGRVEENRAASQFERAAISHDPGRDFGDAAQNTTGRPQTAEAGAPVSSASPAEKRAPTPAELAEAQKRAAKVAASRDPARALLRQHKRDAAEAAKTPPTADRGAEDRASRADELRRIKDSLEREEPTRDDPGRRRPRDRGRTR